MPVVGHGMCSTTLCRHILTALQLLWRGGCGALEAVGACRGGGCWEWEHPRHRNIKCHIYTCVRYITYSSFLSPILWPQRQFCHCFKSSLAAPDSNYNNIWL